jgi:ABC-type iron transport system FetAB permease component
MPTLVPGNADSGLVQGQARSGLELMADRLIYLIVLRAEEHEVDPILRLRALLKRALRDHALKCIRARQLADTDTIDSVGQD